jgi:peptidoglycan/LPS O-acetylase OafA/YrhL
MRNDTPAAKIQEFDILRALAILMLMFHHSEAYGLSLFGYPLEGLNPYFEGILLGIFFFISGYFAERSFQKQNKGSVSFFFSRMLRVYPPYLLGLILYIFMLGISFKKRDLLIYLTGTHFIFAPNYAKPVITIWYIGAIVLFYLVFGILLANLRTTRPLVIVSALVFTAAYALHQWTGLLDERFFKYFIAFLAGILFARPLSFTHWLSGEHTLLKLAIAILAAFIFSLVLSFGSTSPFYILGVVFFTLSWIILLFAIATKIKVPFLLKFAGVISYASYFVYLLHRPLWAWLTDIFSVETFQNQVFFRMIPASILVFILSYYLQYGYDRLLAIFRRNG